MIWLVDMYIFARKLVCNRYCDRCLILFLGLSAARQKALYLGHKFDGALRLRGRRHCANKFKNVSDKAFSHDHESSHLTRYDRTERDGAFAVEREGASDREKERERYI